MSNTTNDVREWDARTGEYGAVVAASATTDDVDAAVMESSIAWRELKRRPLSDRIALLDAMATSLEAHRETIVATADRESGLGAARIASELSRTTAQLRFMGDVVREGAFLGLTIDQADPSATPPRPDLRRMNVPVGVVAVFSASNFPLAFSVAGGDTASAIAAGCAVVVKAHPSHPATSVLVHEALLHASKKVGFQHSPVSLVHGTQAGIDLVQHPEITAVGFTGSLPGANALMSAMAKRNTPIPFYGELGSINPLVVTKQAAKERPLAIGEGLALALSNGAGQFCTKPGVSFVPTGDAGDALVQKVADSFDALDPLIPLNTGIANAFCTSSAALAEIEGVRVLTRAPEPGIRVTATLVEVEAIATGPWVYEEVFGPLGVIVRYENRQELEDLLRRAPGALTGTVHIGEGEEVPRAIADILADRVGRVIINGFPTGVAVSWAQTHGGTYPSSTSTATSVGAAAIDRFVRPVTWQDAPDSALPDVLRNGSASMPRRIDGRLVVSTGSTTNAS